MGTRDNDTDRLLNELFGPPLRRERKLQCLTLYNPWARMYHLYRLGPDGLARFRTLGPVNLRDAKRIEQSYREHGA
ncbi:hypothetical protein Q3P06_10985 [Ralstonia pseudosolanacearum]|uniref:Uncharacterized protein n=1 Tax=Ralstonia pseudosolanacearum TaxID=1310165 RepID=A0A454TUE9_9RALS|nr:hypothetical protein [Ralstonia pseudosolanacearum]MCK4132589.1 hypothetical protein [Ralstonia pseudosolanacearum]MDK1380464.1 hypothetical protein [Ralstonia pseudosolanacearum]MDO3512442.1 hypothetical protein [Ralstonia pseudosolanacearum]MDO3539357.1 hypothetical protein [Ralstonia pseudosolanacearum]MDO3630809.1 hypothetical protein [Ralstonia pseudosolanacearum]